MKTLIRIVAGIITLFLLAASIKYSAAWHEYVGFAPFWAWGLSAAFIVWGNISFDIGIGKGKGASRRRWITVTVVITLYSMVTTIAAQYNALLEKQENNIEIVNKLKYDTLQRQIDSKNATISALMSPSDNSSLIRDIDSQIEQYRTEAERINTILSGITDKEERYKWSTTNKDNESRLDEINNSIAELQNQKAILQNGDITQINKLQDEVSGLQNQQTELVAETPNIINELNSGNIFQYFSKITHGLISPVIIQFLLSLFPAVLLDLISPISSAIAVYGIKEDSPGEDLYKKGSEDAFEAINEEIRRRLTTVKES